METRTKHGFTQEQASTILSEAQAGTNDTALRRQFREMMSELAEANQRLDMARGMLQSAELSVREFTGATNALANAVLAEVAASKDQQLDEVVEAPATKASKRRGKTSNGRAKTRRKR